jgi:beta-glucanase (GH16 family)
MGERASTNLLWGQGEGWHAEVQAYESPVTMDQWQTHSFEWTPDSIKFYIDGILHRTEFQQKDGGPVKYMTKAQNVMMNFWQPNFVGWGDNFDPSKLPYTAEYDYVEVSSYSPDTRNFELLWRDDFNTLDPNRWTVSNNWWFNYNNCVFMNSQVSVSNGSLILKMDKNPNSNKPIFLE